MASLFPLLSLVLFSTFQLSLSLSAARNPLRRPPNPPLNHTFHAQPPSPPLTVATPNDTLHAPPPPPPIPTPYHTRQAPPPPISMLSHTRQAPPPPIATTTRIFHAPPPPIAKTSRTFHAQPPPKPQSLPENSPVASSDLDNHQMNNIVDALIGSGDFGNWIDLLMTAGQNNSNSSSLRLRATLFVPDDVALPESKNPNPEPYPNRIDIDPFLFSYHIVPKRLSFDELRSYAVGSRLPTLLPGNSILITNNSLSNFTVDDSLVTHPDLYLNDAVSVQGIGETFDYKRFGTEASKNRSAHPPPPPPPRSIRSPPHRTRETTNTGLNFLPGEFVGGAGRPCLDFIFCYWISLVVCFSIVIKMLLT